MKGFLMKVSPARLHGSTVSYLCELGLGTEDAVLIADHLVDAECAGYPSHGLMRLTGIKAVSSGFGKVAEPRVVATGGGIKLYEADGQLGIVAMSRAIEVAIAEADENNLVMVGVRGYVGTTGMIGAYARRAAANGLVALIMCHSEYAVAPHGGRRAILGTNPIAIGIPSETTPFVADLATSAWSYGDLRVAMREGRTVPEGVVQTVDGRPSTDPNDADNGSQLPMAGHKGYALGLAVEILCGAFVGGKIGRDAAPGGDAALAIVFREDAIQPKATVESAISALLAEVKSAPLAYGFDTIRVPGEGSDSNRRKVAEAGSLDVDDDLLDSLGLTIA
ncbi:Ldh family oxidoreductase [Micromonospora aurantiaca]|uniref:Ldh family oxidoreductase n=1 Tax=Micromonospora aurantiaca (nom. illeg.) TaxID=47850 RepID=UPI003802CFC7